VNAAPNVEQLGNLFMLLIYYQRLQDENITTQEKTEYVESIGIVADEITGNPNECSYALGFAYYVRAMTMLMIPDSA